MKKFVLKNRKKIFLITTAIVILSFAFYNSYYFDFDRIEHYKITDEINYSGNKDDSTALEYKKTVSEIVFKDYPTRLDGNTFLNDLNKIIFVKRQIPSSDFKEIKEIFKEQYCSIHTATNCIIEFRDVFIFYKKDKIIGVAKICFGCMDHRIIGTTSNTSNFGQCGDYEKLEKIIK